jgi:hypothetical protein
VIAAGELLLGPARAEAQRRSLPTMRDHARVVPAQYGSEAGLAGAASLALDRARRSLAER